MKRARQWKPFRNEQCVKETPIGPRGEVWTTDETGSQVERIEEKQLDKQQTKD